ncbi:MAG: nitroreductase family protein [Vulcanimicrobiota bacterium]
MTVDHLLKTTRAVRKRLDLEREVPDQVLYDCLQLAIQAPTGSNQQGWRFLVVREPERRQALADLYREAFGIYSKQQASAGGSYSGDDPRAKRLMPVIKSAVHLAENMHRVPVLLIGCVQGRVEDQGLLAQASLYGSILPAMWSLQLALRSRGLGSAWTTLHLMFEEKARDLLGIPDDYTQACLLPIAYYKGEDFKPASRLPVEKVTFLDRWDQPFPGQGS